MRICKICKKEKPLEAFKKIKIQKMDMKTVARIVLMKKKEKDTQKEKVQYKMVRLLVGAAKQQKISQNLILTKK